MYLVTMDQLARGDIAAAAAVHRELGADYDGAVAESLVERIGDEIDKRVDARLGDRGGRRDQPAQQPGEGRLAPVQHPWPATVLALGSMGLGIGATALVVNRDNGHGPLVGGGIALVVIIWLIIGVINVAYARRR
jgi:hypothetical protein